MCMGHTGADGEDQRCTGPYCDAPLPLPLQAPLRCRDAAAVDPRLSATAAAHRCRLRGHTLSTRTADTHADAMADWSADAGPWTGHGDVATGEDRVVRGDANEEASA